MGAKFLMDTNAIIDYQSGVLTKDGLQFISKIIDNEFLVSFISYIEFLGFKNATKQMEDFISLATIIDMNPDIVKQTIELRRNYKIKLPDAIIAATALVYNQTLISRNTSDFQDIENLKVVNPYQI